MKKEIKILVLIGGIVIVAAVVAASYYRSAVQHERAPTTQLVRPDSPTFGPADAPVTLVEFLDPECESCRAFNPTVKQILNDYTGRVRLVVRYMPFHHNSVLAATVTEAAGEQGKYWEMQDMLFRRQPLWGERREPQTDLFIRYAAELGLDLERLRSSMAQTRHAEKVERDRQDGQSLGVVRTPTFFVNGRRLARFSEQDLRSLINEELN
jgi:protein-disulfide isomerase